MSGPDSVTAEAIDTYLRRPERRDGHDAARRATIEARIAEMDYVVGVTAVPEPVWTALAIDDDAFGTALDDALDGAFEEASYLVGRLSGPPEHGSRVLDLVVPAGVPALYLTDPPRLVLQRGLRIEPYAYGPGLRDGRRHVAAEVLLPDDPRMRGEARAELPAGARFRRVTTADRYAGATDGPVIEAPAIRDGRTLGVLWAATDRDAAGFVPDPAAGEDGDVAGGAWRRRLNEARAAGRPAADTLTGWLDVTGTAAVTGAEDAGLLAPEGVRAGVLHGPAISRPRR